MSQFFLAIGLVLTGMFHAPVSADVGSGYECGNGIVEPGETCDDGWWNPWGSCSTNCDYSGQNAPYCGDNIVNNTEECDEGWYNGYGTCTTDCLYQPRCGDAICSETENCDSCYNDCGSCQWGQEDDQCGDYVCGSTESCDSCSNDCGTCQVQYFCGDGACNNGESCGTCPGDCGSCEEIQYCGDNSCNNGESCGTCSNDCGACEQKPVCGNNVIEKGEQCDGYDLGNASCVSLGKEDGPLFCNGSCTFDTKWCKSCGNGTLEEGEECDDANQVNGDGCDTSCKNEKFCGNGKTEAGEECDDGNKDDADACSNACKKQKVCGNGKVEEGEECDGSNLNGKSCKSYEGFGYSGVGTLGCIAPGQRDACQFDFEGCSLCGNVKVEAGEECDDGNQNDNDGCAQCRKKNICGDGKKEEGETCDDGNQVNGDGCDSSCVEEKCGNGKKQGNEECDDGDSDDTNACSNACVLNCGNGVVNGMEECDDGNQNDGDACNNKCERNCGNGKIDGEEQCDDGNDDDKDECSNTCKKRCGNGKKDEGETCDASACDSREDGLPSPGCLTQTLDAYASCKKDGYTGGRATCNESCTGFDTNSCSQCGNEKKEEGEQCDGSDVTKECSDIPGLMYKFGLGGSPSCSNTCSLDATGCYYCGDGKTNEGEECDDANEDENDGCTVTCRKTGYVCGNGTQEPGEECDDGNRDNDDECTAECKNVQRCAVCVYMDEGRDEECAQKDAASCQQAQCNDGKDNDGDGKADFPDDITCGSRLDDDEGETFRQVDCAVSKGVCMNTWKAKCENWLETQTKVEENMRHLVREGDEMPDLTKCTTPSLQRIGHGLGCGNFAQLIQACTKSCGDSFASGTCKDAGCSVFENKAEVDIWMLKLQSKLKPGEQLSVTGAQNTQTPDVCTTQAKVTYELDATISRSCQQCNPVGDFCFPDGNKPTDCSNAADNKCNAQQVCCQKRADGEWRSGASCTYMEVPMTAEGKASAWFGCGPAVTNATAAAREWMEKTCDELEGNFSMGDCNTDLESFVKCFATSKCTGTCSHVLN